MESRITRCLFKGKLETNTCSFIQIPFPYKLITKKFILYISSKYNTVSCLIFYRIISHGNIWVQMRLLSKVLLVITLWEMNDLGALAGCLRMALLNSHLETSQQDSAESTHVLEHSWCPVLSPNKMPSKYRGHSTKRRNDIPYKAAETLSLLVVYIYIDSAMTTAPLPSQTEEFKSRTNIQKWYSTIFMGLRCKPELSPYYASTSKLLTSL